MGELFLELLSSPFIYASASALTQSQEAFGFQPVPSSRWPQPERHIPRDEAMIALIRLPYIGMTLTPQ